MYIAGLNPAKSSPAIAEALTQLEFLVVQDLFLTETAQLADVVLPAAAFAEREGTFTNAERRVQHFRQARRPEGDAPPDWLIFQDLARAVQSCRAELRRLPAEPKQQRQGARRRHDTAVAVAAPPSAAWDYVVSSDIADEIGRTVRGYSGASLHQPGADPQVVGPPAERGVLLRRHLLREYRGRRRPAPGDGRRSPRAVFQFAFREPSAPAADERYPLTLLTPTRAYDGGEWMRGSKLLNRDRAGARHPEHGRCAAAGRGMGEKVRIKSAAGALELPATIDAGPERRPGAGPGCRRRARWRAF